MATIPYPISFIKEYHGKPAPPGKELPHPADLVRLCTAEDPEGALYNMGLAYPPESPVFWIKYGSSVVWGELEAQSVAHDGLGRNRSSVSAPAIFYACELKIPGNPRYGGYYYKSYVVMEYAPGQTAAALLDGTSDAHERDLIYASIGLALTELTHIPVPEESRPAGIDGGKIRHGLFGDQEAPIHYQNVQQLEDHLNKWLDCIWVEKPERLQGLAREPLIFCYSDLWLENFIIDEEKRITVIDFSDASFLPSSFLKCAILDSIHKLKRDISDLVTVPSTPGVDNTTAILSCQASLTMAPVGFYNLGLALGGTEEADSGGCEGISAEGFPEEKPLLDSEGRQVTLSYLDLHPDYVEEEINEGSEYSSPGSDGEPPEWIKKVLEKARREAYSPS